MKDDRILKLANQSMKENREVLTALGKERPVQLKKNPDQDLLGVVDLLKDLMPKSTAGKIALVGVVALIAYAILKSK